MPPRTITACLPSHEKSLMHRRSLGPYEPASPNQLVPGALYREAGAFSDQTRFFSVDASGARCFEVTVLTDRVTVDLFERWSDEAAIVAGCRPRPSLVPDDVTPAPARSRARAGFREIAPPTR